MIRFVIPFICLASVAFCDEPVEEDVHQTRVETPAISTSDENIIKPIAVPEKPVIGAPELLEKKHKSPFVTVSLSYLFPGLGHVYLNEYLKAGSLGGGFGLGAGLSSSDKENPNIQSTIALQNTWFYGVYSAYRDVRVYNNNTGYRYKMPIEGFTDLARAPFRFSIVKKPEVWGGMLGFLTLATGITYANLPKDDAAKAKPESQAASKDLNSINPLFAFPVGLGEEVFFRGYLQPMFAEFTNPTGGIILSSLLFGAMHIPNAQLMPESDRMHYYSVSIPYITALGAYMGWISQRNNSLQESIALHTWYDFTLFSIGAIAQKAAIGKAPRFAISIPF